MGNFDWSIIIGPVVGAVIGYCTNFIAVKMLFRPLKEVRIFGIKVPFTPGIIPKEQGRLARAIGGVVGKKLLTQDTLEAYLMSDQVENKIRSEVNNLFDSLKKDEVVLGDRINFLLAEEKKDGEILEIKTLISQKIYDKVKTMNLGEVFAQQAAITVKRKVQGSFLAMMINDQTIDGFLGPAGDMINEYIENNSPEMIYSKVDEEIDGLMKKPFGDVVSYLDVCGIKYADLAVKLYETFVVNKLGDILNHMNIEKIVEDKVNEMDVLEVENLLLSVIKKELNMVVNLGALIGFVLGIIMIFV